MVRLLLRIVAQGKGTVEGDEILAEGEFDMVFEFFHPDLDARLEDGEVRPYLFNTLKMLAYSTSRGILMGLCDNTGLAGLVLPVVRPDMILPLDLPKSQE